MKKVHILPLPWQQIMKREMTRYWPVHEVSQPLFTTDSLSIRGKQRTHGLKLTKFHGISWVGFLVYCSFGLHGDVLSLLFHTHYSDSFITQSKENNQQEELKKISIFSLTFIYFTSLRWQDEAYINFLRWSTLVGLAHSTTVLRTLTFLGIVLMYVEKCSQTVIPNTHLNFGLGCNVLLHLFNQVHFAYLYADQSSLKAIFHVLLRCCVENYMQLKKLIKVITFMWTEYMNIR